MLVAQSGPHVPAKLDGRTREAKLLARKREESTRHFVGEPSSVEWTLIERAARLGLYIEIINRAALTAGSMTERDSRQYLA